ncbi:AraC family transcriptional regulator N-terminal domain-containing protein [Pseudoduganella buxea]|uniref:Transcription regulator HTH AraC N-terminal domain-containing protein n=1 Tax=Pseudoduganella buxea TaxID=1949069 RepID=A0A6I3T1E7_9BURK|nr:AraC family transcriptional regulator N-terminal domain-containing protein [Pseudoduganella buxea]MTV53467.1 hypothetical protein [Pseudoduganella buxea]
MGEGHMPPLPAWLATGLAHRPELLITARQTYSLRAVDFDQPALIVPLQGEKVFTAGQATTHVGPGSYLMVHRACRGTVENIAGQDCYRAWCIVFPWRVVELARRLLEAHALPPAPAASHGGAALAPLHEALRYLLELLNRPGTDAALVDHALVGVLLALHRSGDSQFRLAQDLSVAARIRLQVGTEPGATGAPPISRTACTSAAPPCGAGWPRNTRPCAKCCATPGCITPWPCCRRRAVPSRPSRWPAATARCPASRASSHCVSASGRAPSATPDPERFAPPIERIAQACHGIMLPSFRQGEQHEQGSQ